MDAARNLALLNDYQTYLRVEKGLRPLTCEAYDGDLKTFAEFIESRHGVLLTAAQQDVVGVSRTPAQSRHRFALGGAQAQLPARVLQVAAAGPAHSSRSDRQH